jgi:hypothetical protein
MCTAHYSRRAAFSKYFVATGEPPMNEGTRFGTTMHPRKVVQDSDAYQKGDDGKIKRVAPPAAPCA